MNFEIRKAREGKNFHEAVIITFHTNADKFDSNYERSKFFRELHGWTQIVPSSNKKKKYSYHRSGLLDLIPNKKVADSVFITPHEHLERVEQFFSEWEDKVECNMINIMMNKKNLMQLFSIDDDDEDDDSDFGDEEDEEF